jgi:hypothetical protein
MSLSWNRRIRNACRDAWLLGRPLALLTLAMIGVLALNTLGLLVDHRTIAGDAAWLKPAKFAISTGLYAFSLAVLCRYLQNWRILRRVVGYTVAVSLAIEIVLIDLQAYRGTTSHFNVGTPIDQSIFSTMGFSILCLWVASLAFTVALFRQRFQDPALAWLVRSGMAIALASAGIGALMVRPTSAQVEDIRLGRAVPILGAHTVGGDDGGPGYPIMHWSSEHGDLRVPHFVGLHALQALPLLYLVVGRRSVSPRTRVRLASVASLGYAALVGLLLWQALRGLPVLTTRGRDAPRYESSVSASTALSPPKAKEFDNAARMRRSRGALGV